MVINFDERLALLMDSAGTTAGARGGSMTERYDTVGTAASITMRAFDLDVVGGAAPEMHARALGRQLSAAGDDARAMAYVATPELLALRGDNPDPRFARGRGTGLTLAVDGESAVEPPSSSAAGLLGRFVSTWALDADGRGADAAAVLGQDHAGIQVAYGVVADAAWRATIAAWYRDIHAPDVVEVEGVIGCVRFVSRDEREPSAGEHLVIFVLDDDPAIVMRRVRARIDTWRDAGRTPSPGRASRAVFNGPFLRVDPR